MKVCTSSQITTPTSHHSVFYRPDALPAAQPTASKHWRQTSNTKPLLNNWCAFAVWHLQSAAFKILAHFYNLDVAYKKNTQFKLMSWTGMPNPQNCPFWLGTRIPSTTPCCDWPTHLPRKLDRYMHFLTTMQRSPHWLKRDAPNSPQTAPSPSTITTPSNIPIPRPTHTPSKRHPDPLSCFATVHFPENRQTDRPTHTHTHTGRQMG